MKKILTYDWWPHANGYAIRLTTDSSLVHGGRQWDNLRYGWWYGDAFVPYELYRAVCDQFHSREVLDAFIRVFEFKGFSVEERVNKPSDSPGLICMRIY